MFDALFVKKENGLVASQLTSTRWTQSVIDGEVKSLYPRPSMVRNSFISLDGFWDYCITGSSSFPTSYDGQIRLPFSPEAPLSQVNRQLNPGEKLWYKKDLLLPEIDNGYHYRLNFGAVDQECSVYINSKEVASHVGGYLPFSVDLNKEITDKKFTILVCVIDDSDESFHARGKQKLKRGGMFYTAQSGIWQSVWIEKVSDIYIESVKITPDLKRSGIDVKVKINGNSTQKVTSYVRYEKPSDAISRDTGIVSEDENVDKLACESGKDVFIKLESPRLWTCEDPYLYHLVVSTKDDQVHCYFGMRSVGIGQYEGFPCFTLNDLPCPQSGLLDQGYWPDGLYTAACDEALIYDIETAKSLGFNMLRKHIKIEPERWYYHCDRLGMLVWQDMVCGGGKIKQWFVTYLATVLNIHHIPMGDRFGSRFLLSRTSKAGRDEFEKEVIETIDALYNHPSILVWVPFNEGWGQFDAKRISKMIKDYDSSRLVDHASGWFDQKGGDLVSLHYYFFRLNFKAEKERVLALSEYGGYTWKVEGHSYTKNLYGYGGYDSKESLTAGFKKLMDKIIIPASRKGIFGFVYTQISDIEDEVNGIMTYDREIIKIEPDTLRECNRNLLKK